MGWEYSEIGPLTIAQYAHFIGLVKDSDIFEMPDELPDGTLSHIVLNHTGEAIGYLGDDMLERVVENTDKHPYYNWRLRRMYKKALKSSANQNSFKVI
jgi:hypothetical protein